MISLVNKTEMESNPPKLLNNNSQEAAELLGFSSSDSLDSPSFTHFQAPKQKRKVRFKKPFRSNSRAKPGRNSPPKNFNCRVVEGAKILSYFSLLAIVGALLWYVMSLSQRIQELQNKFADIILSSTVEPSSKLDGQVKQYKKMKKRKELDALVSNGKIGSNKRNGLKKGSGSCSAHELLRHDTDSSDMEDFSILQPRRKGRKKHGSRFCLTSVCLSLCQFILVTTCCLVSGALIWLHIGLREDIDLLRAHLQKVEAGNRNTPEALHVQHSKLRLLESNVTILFTEMRKNIADIDNITLEVKHLKDITNDLKESIAAAPALQELPKNVHALSESIVNFGSKMNALESNLKELKDQQSNIQTTAQNLSGELESLKILVQELTNSTDLQSKSSVNTSSKDVKLQTVVQETNQQVHVLEGKLLNVVESIDKMNSTLKVYSELPAKVDTVNEAIVWITNKTNFQNSLLHSLENFIDTNLTQRLEQLEAEAVYSVKNSVPSNLEYINKSISETITQLVNKEFLHNNSNKTNSDPQSLEQTHDVLVLLAALLKKFEQIPKSYILDNRNATELVKNMLHQAFDEMMASRDLKMQEMELEIKNLTSCIPVNANLNTDSKKDEDLTSPLFVQSTIKEGSTTEGPHV